MNKLKPFILIVFFWILLGSGITHAQKLTIKMADKKFKDFAFIDAIELYEYAYKKDQSDPYVIRQLAEANRFIHKPTEVERWLGRLIQTGNYDPDDLFNYIQALKSTGKYSKAQVILQQYVQIKPDDKRAQMEMSLLEYIKFLEKDAKRYTVTPAGINSPKSDFGPTFLGEDKIVFASSRSGSKIIKRNYKWDNQPFLDMYIADIDEDGRLKHVKPFGKKNIKTSYHEGPACFNSSGTKMFVTRNSLQGGSLKRGTDGVTNLKIYAARNDGSDKDWEIKYGLPINSDEYSVGHPSIDKTGLVLYFASDMPGGYGGTDIYYLRYDGGKWQDPVNLGPKINTASDEVFPYISNNDVLYFSSDGHPGMGGLDIFMSTPENGEYRRIENMGIPINSPLDDFGLTMNKEGEQGYLSSNRLNGRGYDDIYHFVINRIPIIIKGKVLDLASQESIPGAEVTLYDDLGKVIASAVSGPDGSFRFRGNKGDTYKVYAIKEDYTHDERDLETKDLPDNAELKVELFLDKLVVEEEQLADEQEPLMMEEEDGEPIQVITMDYINYDLDKDNIRPDAQVILDKLAALMEEFPDLEVRLESHTDARGDDNYNMDLSKRRARSAYEYLVARGVDPMRIQYAGYGETRLLNHCANGVDCSEAEHEVNRRTIVKAVRKGEYKSKREKRNVFFF
ncbi:hypothetical protein EYV94_03300 [Puteibacter caeruleilacunae]|nr:hypothetical protein EYV94_03300 [Puteibacter caeruleilacunae]